MADCVNDNVVDVQDALQHNSFGLANNPEVLSSLAAEAGADLDGAILFYYTAYERELESDGWVFDRSSWRPRSIIRSAAISDDVQIPSAETITFLGYDVVVFGDYLEHSPLSCNSVAERLSVNANCLLPSLDEAVAAIDDGAFGDGCEDGIYTIFAVYHVH